MQVAITYCSLFGCVLRNLRVQSRSSARILWWAAMAIPLRRLLSLEKGGVIENSNMRSTSRSFFPLLMCQGAADPHDYMKPGDATKTRILNTGWLFCFLSSDSLWMPLNLKNQDSMFGFHFLSSTGNCNVYKNTGWCEWFIQSLRLT